MVGDDSGCESIVRVQDETSEIERAVSEVVERWTRVLWEDDAEELESDDDHTDCEYADAARAASASAGECEAFEPSTHRDGVSIHAWDDGESLVERRQRAQRATREERVDSGGRDVAATWVTTVATIESRLEVAQRDLEGQLPADLQAALERSEPSLAGLAWETLHVEEIVLRRITCVHAGEKPVEARRSRRAPRSSRVRLSPGGRRAASGAEDG